MLWERCRVHRLVQSLLALGLVTYPCGSHSSAFSLDGLGPHPLAAGAMLPVRLIATFADSLFSSTESSAESTRECPEMRQALRVMSLLKVPLTRKCF